MSYNDEFYVSLIGEVFDGYSVDTFQGKDIFIKHLNIRDQRYIHKYYEYYKKKALIKGIESEKDRLDALKKDGLWDANDDGKITSLEYEIANLKKTRDAQFLSSKKEMFQKTINQKVQEVFEIKKRRSEIVGVTAEAYATNRSGDEMLRFSLFKNKDLKESLYTEDEFAELESHEVFSLSNLINECHSRLSEDNIRHAVLRPFFSMYLSSADNLSHFYGKAIIDLTIHQLKVGIYARVFYSIFQYVDDIPDDIREDPDKLTAFSESKRNGGKSNKFVKSDSDASAIFGATQEDIREIDKGAKTISLSDEMKKAGGKLDMQQMMRLAGHDI